MTRQGPETLSIRMKRQRVQAEGRAGAAEAEGERTSEKAGAKAGGRREGASTSETRDHSRALEARAVESRRLRQATVREER